jgi:hypothetical protein
VPLKSHCIRDSEVWSCEYAITDVGETGLGGAVRREMMDPLGSSLSDKGGGGSAGGRSERSIRSHGGDESSVIGGSVEVMCEVTGA